MVASVTGMRLCGFVYMCVCVYACVCGEKISSLLYRAPAAAAAAARWNRERRSAVFGLPPRPRAFEIYKLRLAGNNFLRSQESISFSPADCNIYSKRSTIYDFYKMYFRNCRMCFAFHKKAIIHIICRVRAHVITSSNATVIF